MSRKRGTPQPERAAADTGRELFRYEARREGQSVAVLHGREADGGVVVEAEVFSAGDSGFRRPFAFTTRAHAQQFVDEALTALEYLDCTIVE